jgi:ATP-dependent Lon protease
MLFPAANVKDLDEIPADVRAGLELIPIETMEDVFSIALHRVIIPPRIAGNYVIEIDDTDAPVHDVGEQAPAQAKRDRSR